METFKIVIFYLLLIDSLAVNFIAWFAQKWYGQTFPVFSKYLPVTKLWAALYLILALWIGVITFY